MDTVRRAGGHPAIVGVLAGRAAVGMTETDLADLLKVADLPKLNTANLGLALRRGGSGATTVSATVELAARAGITRQSMGEIIRELVDLGILEMHPDPDDGRAKIVKFSEHGLVHTAAGNQHIIEMEQRFVAEFGAEDYETARRVLEGIVELLRDSANDSA